MGKALPIQAWVEQHVIPSPGDRVKAVDVRNQAIRDLCIVVETRGVGQYIHAPRERHDGYLWYLGVTLA